MNFKRQVILLLSFALVSFVHATGQASSIPQSNLISPDNLVKIIQDGKEKPFLFQVGSRVLYEQAHIPGSEYLGPGSNEDGLKKLRDRVSAIPKNKSIVL